MNLFRFLTRRRCTRTDRTLLLAGQPARRARRACEPFEPLEPRQMLSAVTAYSADAFVDSIGVNIRLDNFDTPYATRYEDVKDRLVELGVRSIRNRAPQGTPIFGNNPNSWGTYINRLNDLADEGIKSVLTYNLRNSNQSPNFGAIDDITDRIEDYLSDSVEAVTGLNEYDNNGLASELNNGGWVETWKDYQQDLYEEINSSSRPSWMRNLPVVGGPLTFPNRIDDVGDVRSMVDVGNVHYYTDERPENNPRLNTILQNDNGAWGNDPVWLTEAGYNNATQTSDAISEQASGKYYPRFLMTNYEAGIDRTYIFELWSRTNGGLDQRESHFGLIDFNGTRDPAFYAIRNMIDILGEASWNGSSWSRPNFTPGSLNYSLSGSTGDVEQMLFQKSDGTFYLALWQNDSVYNTSGDSNRNNSSKNITVNFHQDIDRVRRYSNLDASNGGNVDQTVNNPGGSFTVSVPDEVVILEITTGNSRRLQVENGDETVGLAWTEATTGGVRHAWVPNGQGRSGSADNKDRLEYTIANVPAGTYQLQVRANVNSQGSGSRGSNNSFFVRVNNGDWETFNLSTSSGGWFTQEYEGSDKTFNFTSGDNIVEIANRENGTRLDWIQFNTASNNNSRPGRVQAESGSETAGTAWTNAGSNPRYAWVPNGNGNSWSAGTAPRLTYNLSNVASGTYDIKFRVNVDSGGSNARGANNSIFIRVNNSNTWRTVQFATNQTGWFEQTINTDWNLSGNVTIDIAAREDGTRIDWFELV